MRLTLRVLLAHLHGVLPPADAEIVAERLAQSPQAQQLFDQMRSLGSADAPTVDDPDAAPSGIDDDTLAEYLDNTLGPGEVIELEQAVLADSAKLAWLVASHRAIAQFVNTSQRVYTLPVERFYALGDQAGAPAPTAEQATPVEQVAPVESRSELASELAASAPEVAAPAVEQTTPAVSARIVVPPPVPGVWSAQSQTEHEPPAPPPIYTPSPGQVHAPITIAPITQIVSWAPPAALAPVSLAWNGPSSPWNREAEELRTVAITAAFDVDDRPAGDAPMRFASSWLVSLAVNALVILVLGVWMFPGVSQNESVSLIASMESAEDKLDLLEPVVQTPMFKADPIERAEARLEKPTAALVNVAPEMNPTPLSNQPRVMTVASSATRTWESKIDQSPVKVSTAKSTSGTPGRARSVAADGGVKQAAGVADAVDGILSGIRGELQNGDVMVVWLLDASLSLVDDRQEVAARLEPFYREMDSRQKGSHLLMSAVVAYGNTVQELIAPTQFGQRTIEAVSQVPIDTTGLENVMGAIESCIYQYRSRWKGTIQIVVWTDESGDDILRLEDTIAICRRNNVVVSVVGPTAVFGSERGSHLFVDQGTGYQFLLPIKRGPDTSLPERLMLPYWHESDVPPWSKGGAQVAMNVPWYGGMYRDRLLSGVGPYALTRLSMETGGKFIVLDRAGNNGPVQFETMRQYLPDYGPAAEYIRDLKYHPLRQAVSDVVMMSYQEAEALIPPSFVFNSIRREFYPFTTHRIYQTSSDFRATLPMTLTRETQHVMKAHQMVELGITRLTAKGMDKEYERENSPRWRAWYNLTLGRLLALSVRHVEYVGSCQLILQNVNALNGDTNFIRFIPSSTLKSTDSTVLKRAAEAKALLDRCIQENTNTPWSYLAQWELDQPLGLDLRQIVIPPPQPSMGGGRSPSPVPALPSL